MEAAAKPQILDARYIAMHKLVALLKELFGEGHFEIDTEVCRHRRAAIPDLLMCTAESGRED